MKKLILGLILLSFIGCKQNNNEASNSDTTKLDTVKKDSISIDQPIKLTSNQKFLKDNNFKVDAEFSESQFKEFKKTIESNLFKEISFCDVYNEALKLDGIELKRYLNKYKSIPYFETLLFMYGPKVCSINISSQRNAISSYEESDNVCTTSKDFIKKDLRYPDTAEFSMLDCSSERNTDGSYTILRKVSAKNVYGVQSSYIYKLRLGFKGGDWIDINNWDLISIKSEEYK